MIAFSAAACSWVLMLLCIQRGTRTSFLEQSDGIYSNFRWSRGSFWFAHQFSMLYDHVSAIYEPYRSFAGA